MEEAADTCHTDERQTFLFVSQLHESSLVCSLKTNPPTISTTYDIQTQTTSRKVKTIQNVGK